VPTYNPWAVYGQPIAPCPGFSLFDTFGSVVESGVQFGIGFGIGPFLQMPFGLMAWGLDWLGGAILFHDGAYWTHSHEVRDWGFPNGGRRWDSGRGWQNGGRQMARFGNYNHEALSVHGGGTNGGFGHVTGGPSRPFGNGNERAFGGSNSGNRSQNGFGRGYPGGNPTQPQRPGEQAFGRTPYTGVRPEPVGPRGFMGNGYGSRPGYGGMQPYGGHPGMAYSHPAEPFGGRPSPYAGGQGFRPAAPGGVYGRGGYPGQPSRSFGSNGFGNQPRFSAPRSPEPRFSQPGSGGGHWFGGGHSAPSYGGSHAFNGGGRSFGGGGFSSHSFGGGGHSFGGGGHSFGGGGHSGGGHSSGGHSGGHHR
jgi:hypothetical protein